MIARKSSSASASDRPSPDTVSANGQQGEASSAKAGLAILLIDDRPEVASAMEIAFRMAGHSLTVVHEPEEAFSQLARSRFDGIVLDLNFTPGKSDGKEGLACLARIMADDPAACVVVLTAHGGVRMAVAAMQAGARDFAVKPWNNVDLIGKVEAAVAREPTVPAAGATAAERTMPPARILGESAPIEELRQLIRRVGPTMAGVAITGPSGAGRMLSALAVHAASADAQNMPLRIDLREEGALDAIGDASGSVILRYPDRLGELAQDRLAAKLSENIRPISIVDRPAETALREADWPGEVRGLAAEMERAVLLCDDGTIDTAALSIGTPVAASAPAENNAPSFDLDRTEKAMIAAALAEHHHNVSHAAKALGLSRGALYRRMERHGL